MQNTLINDINNYISYLNSKGLSVSVHGKTAGGLCPLPCKIRDLRSLYRAARARQDGGMRYIMSQHMHMQFVRSTIKRLPMIYYSIV